jgi:hypothetical protein
MLNISLSPDEQPSADPIFRAELEQLERILRSETFRNSESLRRLLKYLAENSLRGRGDELKEYSVGVDAFGKSVSYDPRQDSSVRLQVGRLRQKLTDYYRGEGHQDPLTMDLPKRHFKVTFGPRLSAAVPAEESAAAAEPRSPQPSRRPLVLALVAVAAFAFLAGNQFHLKTARATNAAWPPELNELWKPFLASARPIIVSVADPLFVRLGDSLIVRDPRTYRWEDVLTSEAVKSAKAGMRTDLMQPSFGWAPFGDLDGSFMLARLISTRRADISLSESTGLTSRMLGENNLILLGTHVFFDSVFHNVPVAMRFRADAAGVHDLAPHAGQPALYPDHSELMPNGLRKGVGYAVVIAMPGPFGQGEVLGFTANSPTACLGAIRCFTDAGLARALLDTLRQKGAALPRYYEVMLKVSYENSMPVQISYVAHSELRVAGNLVSMTR